MELAVPIIALGGLYVASNQNNNKKEGYQNVGKNKNSLPNNDTPPINYPKLAKVNNNNTQKYNNPNTVTDRYYKPSVYQEYANGPDQFGNTSNSSTLKSLTGEPMNKDNFKHNNMTPYFGAKITGTAGDANLGESILDNMIGSGSQQIKKHEQAPMFAPQKDIRHAHGAPNQSEFYQSRVMPSSNMNNVKLWDEQRVGPALDAGYNTKGELGFNSGMAAREKWVDRNVDQLRVETNPKLTFGLENHEGPAQYFIQAPATKETQGKVEKYLPDTYYLNTPDRWLTTTGLEKGQTARAIQVDRDVNRSTTSSEYFGIDSNPQGTMRYTPGEFQQPKRPQLQKNPVLNATARGQGSAGSNDYGKNSYKILPNNRTTVQAQDVGIVNGIYKAAVAPIMDILRPSRKENVIGNINPTGNVQVPISALPVYNPADRAPTTIKETTVDKLDFNHLNVQGQTSDAYTLSNDVAVDQERDTTNQEYFGDGGTNNGVSLYNAAYNQRNNVNKTSVNRPNQGGMSLLNHKEVVKIDKNEQDRRNNRMWVRNNTGSTSSVIPSIETYGKINVPQYYDNCQNCDRINPDILNAFKENPYTQSLNSYR